MLYIVLTLFIIAFTLGIEKFVTIGIIQYIANDLKISLTTANYFSVIYSISITLTGPIITLLFRNMSKKTTMLCMLLIVMIGNFIIFISDTFIISILGRFIASFATASFFGLSSILIYQLINEDKRAFSISLISLGVTFSNAIGVPICTFISHHYGWRWSFGFVSILSIIAIGMVGLFIPKNHARTAVDIKKTKVIDEIRTIIHNPSVWSILLISFIQYSAFSSTITYMSILITNFLQIPKTQLPLMLSIFGIGMACGSVIGGKLYDHKIYKAPIYIGITILLLNLILPFIVNLKFSIFSMIALFCLASSSFSLIPFYKAKIVEKAIDAPSLASTTNIVILNLGFTFGSLLAGILIKYYKVPQISFFSAGITIITITLIIYNLYIDNKINKNSIQEIKPLVLNK